jgi:hypothetical protein
MASGYVSWTTPDGNSPNPVYIDDTNKSVEFSAREDVAPYTITRPVGSVIYTLSNLGIINGFQCYRYAVYVTATTTTTTTTTEPPEITLTTVGSCTGIGIEGTGRVVASGFSGGSGTYSTIRIGTSMENAFDATPINLSGATSYQFDNLNSAVWFVLVTDSAGYQGYARQIINCTNTTTTAGPTSTTTEASTTTTTSTSTTSTSTTTTTGAPLSFNLAFDASSGTTACSNYPATNTALRYAYYTATLGNGIQLFTSTALSTAVANGYYSNGTNYWLATSGILNSQVSCTNPCGFNGGTAVYTAPTTTTTTTAAPTTTTAAPTTTTAAPTTTTAAPTTTTAAPTTTTAAPTTTTAAPTTTTAAPTTTTAAPTTTTAAPTTTTAAPTTTTAAPSFTTYNIGPDYANATSACTSFSMDFHTEVYAAEAAPALVTRFYTDTALTVGFVGSSDFYAWALAPESTTPFVNGQVSSLGNVSNITGCAGI